VLGPATISAVYSNTEFSSLGSVVAGGASAAPKYNGGTAVFNSGEISVKYLLLPALQVGGGYIYTHNGGAGGLGSAHYNQGNLGAVYSLSKRTSVYLFGLYQVAAGRDSTGQVAVANLASTTNSSNNKEVAAFVGMVHRF
jgi:predicted porin